MIDFIMFVGAIGQFLLGLCVLIMGPVLTVILVQDYRLARKKRKQEAMWKAFEMEINERPD